MQTQQTHLQENVRHDGRLLIAVVPPIGSPTRRGATRGYIKLVRGGAIEVETSELEYLDSNRNILERRDAAFGQTRHTRHVGPLSTRVSEERGSPTNAATLRWRLNQLVVAASLLEAEDVAIRVIYLPLHVDLEGTPDIVVTLVNRTSTVVNIAEGMRSAVCLVDGKPYPSARGGHWDGGAGLNPGFSTTRHFNLNDFPGAPRTGRHEMRFEMLGLRSDPHIVEWVGE